MAMSAVEMRSTIPLLAHIMFRVQGRVLRIRASDLDLQVDAECEAMDAVEHQSFCLPADRLKSLVASLPEKGEIAFGAGRLRDQVSISSGRTTLSIPCLPGEDFPSIGTKDAPDWFEVDGDELSKAISKASFAYNKKDDRAYLTGICFHPTETNDGSTLTLAATDGISLARIHCGKTVDPKLPPTKGHFNHVIVPGRTAESLRKLFEGAQSGCSVAANSTLLYARREGVSITSKVIDGTYPGYERVIPPSRENYIEAPTAAITAAIKRVCVVVDDQKHDAMRLTIVPGGIRLDLVGETGGIATDEVACEVAAPSDFEIGLNGAQLMKLMSSVTTERVRIYLTDHQTAIAVVPVGADGEVFVLQHMRYRIAPGRDVA